MCRCGRGGADGAQIVHSPGAVGDRLSVYAASGALGGFRDCNDALGPSDFTRCRCQSLVNGVNLIGVKAQSSTEPQTAASLRRRDEPVPFGEVGKDILDRRRQSRSAGDREGKPHRQKLWLTWTGRLHPRDLVCTSPGIGGKLPMSSVLT